MSWKLCEELEALSMVGAGNDSSQFLVMVILTSTYDSFQFLPIPLGGNFWYVNDYNPLGKNYHVNDYNPLGNFWYVNDYKTIGKKW
jgi:hypothetical protein